MAEEVPADGGDPLAVTGEAEAPPDALSALVARHERLLVLSSMQ
jgi:hypothetical protein